MQSMKGDVLDKTSATQSSVSGDTGTVASWKNDLRQRWAYDVKAFIGHELTLISEVEHVFVNQEDDDGKVFRVTVIVDARDSKVRASIYQREQAIMDELKDFDFDFHIIAREGRPLEELITDAGAGSSAL